jgi:hypothetical protein
LTDLSSQNFFEQKAFKRATVRGALQIDGAMTSLQCRARLGEPSSPALRSNWQPQLAQPFRIVVTLQTNVRKQHSVTAKPAREAKLPRPRILLSCHIQCPAIVIQVKRSPILFRIASPKTLHHGFRASNLLTHQRFYQYERTQPKQLPEVTQCHVAWPRR